MKLLIFLPLLLFITAKVSGEMEPPSETIPDNIKLDNMANEEQSPPHDSSHSMSTGKTDK
uniref:Uncharacterized protein n=1 Tax=Plectus sambesii TaxID=2011161 RepID=A0A914WY19_9BILA